MKSILSDFFRAASVRKALRLIESMEISGWEIWLQVELARFVAEHPRIGEWHREYPLTLDRRMRARRRVANVDFVLRQKWGRKDRPILVELKQRRRPSSCVRGMIRDLQKLSRLRRSSANPHSVWAVGVHRREGLPRMRNRIYRIAKKRGVSIVESLILHRVVRKTPWAWTTIGIINSGKVAHTATNTGSKRSGGMGR